MTRHLFPAAALALALAVPHHASTAAKPGTSSISAHSAPASVTPSASTTIRTPFRSWAVQTLGTLPDDTFSTAHDVNDAGAVVGVSGSGQLHAVVWKLP